MQISNHIHQLKIDFEIILNPQKRIPRFVNVLILFGEKIILVDTGVKGSEELIYKYIREQGRSESEITGIILSHAHPDHIGSAAAIKEKTGCSILSHPLERPWIEDIQLQQTERPIPGFLNLVDMPVLVDEKLTDAQEIQLDEGIAIIILHTPGHSKGSISLWVESEGVLFTADSIPIVNDIPNYDDYPQLLQSIKKLESLSDVKILLSSWSPPMLKPDSIFNLIQDGKKYMENLDQMVNEAINTSTDSFNLSRNILSELGLPPELANPTTEHALRSHFSKPWRAW